MAKYAPDKRPKPTPKAKKLWDPPPRPKKGDEKPDSTFAAVGRALTAWEEFENAFAHLFSMVLGVTGDNLPAIRAYGAIQTFRGRSDMMKAAAEAYFFEHPREELQLGIDDLVVKAVGFSGRRNEIAHGIVRHILVPGRVIGSPQTGMTQLSESWGWAVVPSDYMTGKTELAPGETLLSTVQRKPKYIYSSVEVVLVTKGFWELRADTYKLAHLIHAWIVNVVHRSVPRK